MTTPQGPGDQRRADIKVHKDGTTWLVDVGVVCPGTRRLLAMGTDVNLGRAAAVYSDIHQSGEVVQRPEQLRALYRQQDGRRADQGRRAEVLRDTHRPRRSGWAGAQRRAGSGQAAGLHTCWRRLLSRRSTRLIISRWLGDVVGAEEVVVGGDDDGDTEFGSVHHHHVDEADFIRILLQATSRAEHACVSYYYSTRVHVYSEYCNSAFE